MIHSPKPPTRPVVYRPGDKICDALFQTKSAQRNRDKTYREGPIETFPGIFSSDPRLLGVKDELSRRLTKAFPASVDHHGRVTGNGVRGPFWGLRHVNGYPMMPGTYPLVDNTFLREKSGLANSFVKDWHRLVFRAIVKLFFSDLEPVPMRLNKSSSSMIPFYTKAMVEKQAIATDSMHNARSAGEMMVKGDYTTPFLSYGIGGAYHTVYRRQSSDAITYEKGVFKSKDRPVADLAYALSGGREGTFLPAEKSFDKAPAIGEGFWVPEGFFRERNRTAKGGPLPLGATLMPVAQAVRQHIYKEYPYTYHHTTRTSIQADVRELLYTIAADVSNHDIYWPHFALEETADVLLNDLGYAEWWVQLYVTKSRLPDYVTDVGPGEGNVLLGDWRSPCNRGGLPSGNPFTDLEGTLMMTFTYLILQVEHTYPELISSLSEPRRVLSTVDRYLKGNLPIKLKDKSDDAVLGWSEVSFVPRAVALHELMVKGEQVSPYMAISYEHGGAFLGSLFLYPADKNPRQVVLIGNILSYVINQLSPEYGVQSGVRDRSKVRRPYGGLAWSTMAQNYGSCPIYSEVKEEVERAWMMHFGESYNAFREQWLKADTLALRDALDRTSNQSMPELSPADIEVLSDPSRLEWKYDRSDVSPAIVEALFNGVGLSVVEPYFESIFA